MNDDKKMNKFLLNCVLKGDVEFLNNVKKELSDFDSLLKNILDEDKEIQYRLVEDEKIEMIKYLFWFGGLWINFDRCTSIASRRGHIDLVEYLTKAKEYYLKYDRTVNENSMFQFR